MRGEEEEVKDGMGCNNDVDVDDDEDDTHKKDVRKREKNFPGSRIASFSSVTV